MNTILFIGIIIFSYAGLCTIALSQTRHWHKCATANAAASPTSFQSYLLRSAGTVLLAISLMFSLLRDGYSFGIILYAITVMCCCLATAMTVNLKPELLQPAVTLLMKFNDTNVRFVFKFKEARY